MINDFGEKIGGARKDVWKERGLMVEDLDGMTQMCIRDRAVGMVLMLIYAWKGNWMPKKYQNINQTV